MKSLSQIKVDLQAAKNASSKTHAVSHAFDSLQDLCKRVEKLEKQLAAMKEKDLGATFITSLGGIPTDRDKHETVYC